MKQINLKPINARSVWRGPELAKHEEDWTYRLNADDIAALDEAVSNITAKNMDVLDITQDQFALAGLADVLKSIGEDLQNGLGFKMIRGVPVKRYDIREAAIAYFGIGSHLGEAVSQNARGHALGHVCNLGFDPSLPTARGYQSANKLNFHTDPTDLVGLMCLRKAKSGGLSSIVSAGTVYNEMLKKRPDLVQILTEPLYRDRRGEIPKGREPWYRLPVFNFRNGHLTTNYVRSTIEKAQRFEEVPRLTETQREAFSLIESIAADPTFYLNMEFQPGDIQLLNNHYIMHSRTAYEDYPEPEHRRHLLRLWLATKAGPPLADPYFEFMDKTASGRPNGYLMPGVKLTAPLVIEDGGPGASESRFARH
tara:strand:- start:6283 stop:7380 length:1098 start_codon:yes stop_codon:yes gene_type:complete